MLQVLVVDPNTDLSGIVADCLHETFGTFVSRAVSGETATQVLRKLPCDLALIEAMLPDMSGFELAERAASRNVPAVLMSGHPKGLQTAKAHRFPYLEKPFSLRDLSDAAKTALREGQRNIEVVHDSFQSLAATLRQTRELNAQSLKIRDEARLARIESRQIKLESRKSRAERSSAREARQVKVSQYKPGTPASIDVLVALENIDRFRRLLQPGGPTRLDEQTERTVNILLMEEEAKLLALDETAR